MRHLPERFKQQAARLKRALNVLPWLDQIEAMVGSGSLQNLPLPLGRAEQAAVTGALRFNQLNANDVSTPRGDMAAVQISNDWATVLRTFQESHHISLPVYGRDLDDIVGMIDLKTMLDQVTASGVRKGFSLAKLLKPATFVPETMSLPKVLEAMTQNGTRMALVSDEYGGTSGLLTLRDLMDELVGDEADIATSHAALTALGGGRYRVKPTLELAAFTHVLAAHHAAQADQIKPHLAALPADVQTVGGWVLTAARKVPNKGDRFQLAPGLTATVTAADARRIMALEIKVGRA